MARVRPGTLVALVWAFTALGLTILLSPELGKRGLAWLWVHNLVCAVGVGHELWRARTKPR